MPGIIRNVLAHKVFRRWSPAAAGLALLFAAGCTRSMVRYADRDVARLIEQRQREGIVAPAPRPLVSDELEPLLPDGEAYNPHPAPTPLTRPHGFDAPPPASQPTTRPDPASGPVAGVPTSGPAAMPDAATTAPTTQIAPPRRRYRDRVFTLRDALAYAQQHQRAYLNAQEDLYLAALALTLERHLWTPQFAARLRGIYGNYGEVTDFDQATRFVAELSVSQRLPLGGEFTAAAISTLIRDVKRSITATENSSITLALDIPFLRSAGHVAREDLIQLERSLTYAVRSFERFRRRQLVEVAQRYFSLLASKQSVLDAEQSVEDAKRLYDRARDFQKHGRGSPLDTSRAETRWLAEQNRLAREREAFRAATDRFKIAIGMPVDEQIGLDDLESIETIEQRIKAGEFPLLRMPPAAFDEEYAVQVARQYRLDLLTKRDQIEDARRGVAIARNALLPDLNWTSSLTFDTDPEHYNMGAFEVARATWRSEVLLSINDRFRERNRLRASLIDVRRARRDYIDALERVIADVRQAVHQIALQDETLRIQQANLEVAMDRKEHAEFMFNKGRLSNRDLVEAQAQLVDAQNRLNLAKTQRWSALLDFRLATGTLRIDEAGQQEEVPELLQPATYPASQPASVR